MFTHLHAEFIQFSDFEKTRSLAQYPYFSLILGQNLGLLPYTAGSIASVSVYNVT